MVSDENNHQKKTMLDNFVRYFCMLRNALVIIACTIVVYFCSDKANISGRFMLSGELSPGLPEFKVPEFYLAHENKTEIGFFQIIHEFDYNIIFLSLAAVLMNISIAKSFCRS